MIPKMHRMVLCKRPVAVTSGARNNDNQHRDLLFSVDPASTSITVDTTANRTVINFGEISAFNVVCVGHQIFLIVGQADGALVQVEVAASSSGAVSQTGRRDLTQLVSAVAFVSQGIDVGPSTYVFVADLAGLWRLIEVGSSGDAAVSPAVVTIDTSACQCTSWQPDQGPLCLTVIHGAPPGNEVEDECGVRRYALMSRCFGRDVAATGSTVVTVGCASGLVAWFALPRVPHSASTPAAAEVQLAVRLWRLCEGGAVVDLLLLDLRPGQDFKSCGEPGTIDRPDTSAMMVDVDATSSPTATTGGTFSASSVARSRVDLSTHLCAVVQPHHHSSPHSSPPLHPPLLTLVCDGVRRAACRIVVGDDCVLSVPSAGHGSGIRSGSSSSNGHCGHGVSDGSTVWEYVGALIASDAAAATGTVSRTVAGTAGDMRDADYVCALLLLVDGGLHACALTAPLDNSNSDQSPSSGRLLLPPGIIVGRGDGCSGRFVTACAVGRRRHSDSCSSSSSSARSSASSSSSSSSSAGDAHRLCLWLAIHNHRTGGTDTLLLTHPHPHPHLHSLDIDGIQQPHDDDLVHLLRRLCGTAANSGGSGSARIAETSSLIQGVMGRMEAAAIDEKGEH